MDLYAKGQLSFLILNCLFERDFYGLDFISEIYNKSNGRIELKKPSVYSNLTRMEKQGYVSSYLKNSDLGPNRKYYSITEKGRNFYQELKEYFNRNSIDVFKDFKDNEIDANTINIIGENTNYKDNDLNLQDSKIIENQQKELANEDIVNNNDYFDFSVLENNNTDTVEANNTHQEQNILESTKELDSSIQPVQTDTYSIKSLLTKTDINSNNKNDFVNKVSNEDEKLQTSKTLENIKNEEKKDDAVFLKNKDVEEYNKRLYDISKDINKYKRKKSFAEDQIAFQVDNSSPIRESYEKTKSNIEDFKNSIHENKGKINTNYYDYSKQMSNRYNRANESYQDILNLNKEKLNENQKEDDGRFITNRLDSSRVSYAKKIEPPRLKILTESSSRENSMPPPKRDKSIDPSHKEILSRLYSKSKDVNNEEVRPDALYDYNDLKDFYREQNISFNEYHKPAERTEHNTNKINLIVSLITFIISSFCSAVLYSTLLTSNLINYTTSFLYILLPALLLLDIIIKFYNFKKYKSWLPNPMLQQWKVWGIAFLLSAIIVGLNFIFGMSPSRFSEFSTTTLLPILMVFIVGPLRYYIKRFSLIRYWR